MKLGGSLLILDENLMPPGQLGQLVGMAKVAGFNATSPIEIWSTGDWHGRGQSGMSDTAIIGYARQRDAIVVTQNRKDFHRFESKENFAFAAPRPQRGRRTKAGGDHKTAVRVLWLDQTKHEGDPPQEIIRKLLNFDQRMAVNPQIWDGPLEGDGIIELT